MDVPRIVSVVGVVAIHVFGNMVGNDAVRGSARWWAAVVVDLGFVWVVPVVVMISGASILEPRQFATGPADFYRRRLLRLGPAFVFWPLFYVFVVNSVMAGEVADAKGSLLGAIDGRSYTYLYFLWLIVGLYIVAPVLAAFLQGGGRRRGHDALLPIGYFGPVVTVVALAWFVVGVSVLNDWRPRRTAGFIRVLSDASFGVFLVHFALIHVVRTVPAPAPTDEFLPVTILVWVLVTELSFALVVALRRIPWVHRLV